MKLINYLSYLVITLAIVLLLYFYYLLFWPITVIVANVQPYKIITPVVPIGGSVIYEVNACKNITLMAHVVRTFQGNILTYPGITTSNNIPSGCHRTEVSVPIPDYINPGQYFLKLDAIYELNAFRTIEEHFQTGEFTVTKATQSGGLR